MVLYLSVLAVTLLGSCLAAPPVDSDPAAYDLENYDVDTDTWDLSNYESYESYDYEDLDGQIKVETVAPPLDTQMSVAHVPDVHPEEEREVEVKVEVTLPAKPTKPSVLPTLDFQSPGLFGPESGLGMPTCLLCVCLSGSVYCDDSDLAQVPPLPKDTTHFYGRFNKISEVKAKDFINLNQLMRIDLTGNQISKLHEEAFRSLPQLQDLMLADNIVQNLPELPATMKHIDLRNNHLRSSGMHREAFKEMKELQFLYLSNNELNYIPTPLPDSLQVLHLQNNNIQSLNQDTFCNSHDINYVRKALEDIRLDGNPVDVNLYAQAYVCLPRLPVGTLH